MDIDPGTPEERLRKAAAWAHDDNRPLLASACLDGANAIKRLKDQLARAQSARCNHYPGQSECDWCR